LFSIREEDELEAVTVVVAVVTPATGWGVTGEVATEAAFPPE